MRFFLRSKIHKARVTSADVSYVGSVTIDQSLMERAGIAEYEKVLIVDNTNGARLETYALAGEPDTGVVQINGGAARLVNVGDEVILLTFEATDHARQPTQILVDEHNRFVRYL